LLSLAAEFIFEIDNHIDIELRGEKNVSAQKTHSKLHENKKDL